MPDVGLRDNATASAPKDYTIPLAQEIILKGVRASIDGSGAGASFLPALQLVAPDGTIMWTATQQSVAAGGSADCTWFPHVAGTSSGTTSGVIPWPAGNQAASTLDSTTYADTPDGAGTFETLVVNGGSSVVTGAHAYLGDAHPFMIATGYTTNTTAQGFWFGDGTHDPWGGPGNAGFLTTNNTATHVVYPVLFGNNHILFEGAASANGPDDLLVATGLALQPQQNPTNNVQLWSGTGAPTIGGRVGDIYFRQDGGASNAVYQCTVAGVAGAATWAVATGGGGGGGGVVGGGPLTCTFPGGTIGSTALTFAHGLGHTPTAVALTPVNQSIWPDMMLSSMDATNITVIAFESAEQFVGAGVTQDFYWMAF